MKTPKTLPVIAGFVLLAFTSAPLRAQSVTYENVTVTGTGDFQGESTMFGSWTGGGGVAGLTVNYSGTGSTTLVNFIGSGTSSMWQWWQYNGSENLLSLKLDQNNQLTIFTSGTGGSAGITLNPASSGTSSFAGSVAMSGTNNTLPNQVLVNSSSILTQGLGDSRYVQNSGSGVLIGSTYDDEYGGTGPSLSLLGGSATAPYSIAGLGYSQATGFGAVAFGWGASATGQGSTGLGSASNASGIASFSAGNASAASGAESVALGYSPSAYGDFSSAIGYAASASGQFSLAAQMATANGDYSIAIGQSSYTDTNGGYGGVAIGQSSSVDSPDAYSGGIAIGNNAAAYGDFTTALGYYTTGSGCYQFVVGCNNIPQGDPSNWNGTDELFVVGNGVPSGAASNALVVFQNGDTNINGVLVVSGTSGNASLVTNGGLIITGTTVAVTVGSGTVNTVVASGTNNLLLVPQQGDLSMGMYVAGSQPVVTDNGDGEGGGGSGSGDAMRGGSGFGSGGSSGMGRFGGGGSGIIGVAAVREPAAPLHRALRGIKEIPKMKPLPVQPPGERNGVASIRVLAALALLCLLPILIFASPPGWWSTRNVTTGGTANDYAAANQGQLKNIATAAFNELSANLPGGVGDMTAPSGTLPGGTGWQLTNLINSWSTTTSGTLVEITGSNTADYAAANLGQLKHVSRLFYKRLIEAGFASYYPWEATGSSPNDYAVANIGQVKNLFSFDVTTASDGDGVPDMWEMNWFDTIGISGTSLAPSGNGLTVYQAYEDGVSPLDYYIGISPTLTIVGGNNQTGAPGELLSGSLVVKVTGTSGSPMVNAPVVFMIGQGSGVLAPDNSGTSATSDSLLMYTGTDGQALVWFQQPTDAGFTSVVSVYAEASEVDFNEATSADTGSPAAPSEVTPTIQDDGSVLVTWKDNSDNETGFIIQRSDDGGDTWTTTGTTDPDVTYIVDCSNNSGVIPGVTQYSAEAIATTGTTPALTTGTAILPLPTISYAPIDISGTNASINVSGSNVPVDVLSMAVAESGTVTYCFASGTFPVAVGSGSANGGVNQITVNTWSGSSGSTTSGAISADSPAQSITEDGTAAYPGLRDESLSADNSLYQNASGSGGDYDFDWIETPYILNSPPPSVIVTPDGNAYGTAVENCYFPYVVNPADTREWPPIVVDNAFFWSGSTQQKQTREFTDPSFTTGTANLIVNNYGLADYELYEVWVGSPLGSMVLACSQAGYCGVGLFGVPDPYLSESDQNWYVENGGTFNDLFVASYICTSSGTTIFYDPGQWDNEFLAWFSPWEPAGINAIATAFTPSAMNDSGNAAGGSYFWSGTSGTLISLGTNAVATGLNDQNIVIGSTTDSGTQTGMLWLMNSGSASPVTLQSLVPQCYQKELTHVVPYAISGTDCNNRVSILCSGSAMVRSGTAISWMPKSLVFNVDATTPSGTSSSSGTTPPPSFSIAEIPFGTSFADQTNQNINSSATVSGVGAVTTTGTGGATTSNKKALLSTPVKFEVTQWDPEVTTGTIQYLNVNKQPLTPGTVAKFINFNYLTPPHDILEVNAKAKINISDNITPDQANSIASQWKLRIIQNVVTATETITYLHHIVQRSLKTLPVFDDVVSSPNYTTNHQEESVQFGDSGRNILNAFYVSNNGMFVNYDDPLQGFIRITHWKAWLVAYNETTKRIIYLKWVTWHIHEDVSFTVNPYEVTTHKNIWDFAKDKDGDGAGTSHPNFKGKVEVIERVKQP